MREWLCTNDRDRPIFWLSGPGGSGKSAIAHTFAEECDGKKVLAGSFFFLRGDKFRTSYHNFFFTLAYQLAIGEESMRALMQTALMDNPDIPYKTLEKQFKMLIYDPILALEQSITIPRVVVVDALDECEDKDGILKIISVISNGCRNPSFPLRFLFTSRAYEYISTKFRDTTIVPLMIQANLQDWQANDDIRRVLRQGFQDIRIRRQRVMGHLPEIWPSDADLGIAVEKSEGLFIWAATVLKFVGSERGHPEQKFVAALKLHPGLDSLYRQVIQDAPRDDPYNSVIGAIPLLRVRFSAWRLGQLLSLRVHEILDALQGLEPILDIPENIYQPLQPYHASLHDFLTDRDRSGGFYINPAKQHFSIMLCCLGIITDDMVIHREIDDYARTNLFYHYRCALTQEGMVNFPLSEPHLNGFKEIWRSPRGLRGDVLRDLEVVVSKLEVSS